KLVVHARLGHRVGTAPGVRGRLTHLHPQRAHSQTVPCGHFLPTLILVRSMTPPSGGESVAGPRRAYPNIPHLRHSRKIAGKKGLTRPSSCYSRRAVRVVAAASPAGGRTVPRLGSPAF